MNNRNWTTHFERCFCRPYSNIWHNEVFSSGLISILTASLIWRRNTNDEITKLNYLLIGWIIIYYLFINCLNCLRLPNACLSILGCIYMTAVANGLWISQSSTWCYLQHASARADRQRFSSTWTSFSTWCSLHLLAFQNQLTWKGLEQKSFTSLARSQSYLFTTNIETKTKCSTSNYVIKITQ